MASDDFKPPASFLPITSHYLLISGQVVTYLRVRDLYYGHHKTLDTVVIECEHPDGRVEAYWVPRGAEVTSLDPFQVVLELCEHAV